MILIKFLIFTAIILGIFALIYKYFDKIKVGYTKIKEKVQVVISIVKVKIMNVYIVIKNFFGRIFTSAGR